MRIDNLLCKMGLTILFWLPLLTQAADMASSRIITVTGVGTVFAAPDTARVSIGVVTEAESAADATGRNSRSMQILLSLLRERGFGDRDIQTTFFGVAPQYSYQRGKAPPELTGYRVTNQVRLTVREFDRLGAILDEIIRAGANQVNGIQFEVAARQALLDDARVAALADARRKAALYAGVEGLEIGEMMSLHETPQERIRPPISAMARAREASAVPIAGGEQALRITVTVAYSVK